MPRILSLAGGLAGATALAVIVATPAANAEQTLTGSASALKADVKVVGEPVNDLPATPEVTYPEGGDESLASFDSRESGDAANSVIIARLLNAASNETDGTLQSRASLVDLWVGLQNPPESDVEGAALLAASFVNAECSVQPDGTLTAESHLAQVYVGGYAGQKGEKPLYEGSEDRPVKLDPNTTHEIDGVGKIVFNEQIRSEDGKGITVNAVHITLNPGKADLAKADIIVSQATCFAGKGGGDGDDSPAPSGSQSTSPGSSDGPSEPGTSEPSESDGTNGGGGGGEGGLPVTGGKLALVAGLGGGLLAAGGAAIWFTRRRNQEEEAEPEVS